MGNNPSSSPNSPYLQDNDDPYDPFDGIDTLGYRVLGVQPNSPASKAGLVSFLDFLVGANGQMLLGTGEGLQDGEEYDDIDLPSLLEENKGRTVEFLVFNIKSQESRLLELTPADDWGGAGLLGVTIRLDNYAGAEDRLIRVLEVEEQSPAAIAGLVPYKDFLLGTTTTSLDSTQTLATLLRTHEDQVVELYVYNCDSDVVRVVALLPTLSWGGRGLLGAAVGTGYLHRLPSSTRSTEGVSVERKVRYVGVKQPASSDPSKSSAGTIPTLGAQHAIVELEPQLEMELDDDAMTQDTSEEMSSVALSVEDSPAVRTRHILVETVTEEHEDRAPKRPERGLSHIGANRNGAINTRALADDEPQTNKSKKNAGDAPAAREPGLADSQRSTDAPGSIVRDLPPHNAESGPSGDNPKRNSLSSEPHPFREMEGRHRCNSADELFALPEPPPSPVVDVPAKRTSYTTPSSFTNFLPPPPKMHYSK